MTINELLALNNLTANDQIPVWDAEATGSTEPTAKITAQNFANAVKSLANLISTGDMDATPTQGSTNAVQSGGVYTAIAQSTAPVSVDVMYQSNVTYNGGGVYTVGKMVFVGIRVTINENSISGGAIMVRGLPKPIVSNNYVIRAVCPILDESQSDVSAFVQIAPDGSIMGYKFKANKTYVITTAYVSE